MRRRALFLAACCSPAVATVTSPASAADVKRGWGGGDPQFANLVNARWFYNWGPGTTNGIAHGEFVPMVWGNGNFNNDLNTARNSPGAQYLMGFNEPERPDQANMSVATAISRWPAMMTAGLKLVSPAVSDTTDGRAWIADFMSQANANSLRVDAVAFHWYGTVDPANPEGSASGFLSRVDAYYNLYQKPIWITEWGGIDWGGAHSTATMNEANRRFLIRAIAGLESRAYVERYAWWNWADDTRLNVNGATPFTPSVVGNEYIPSLMAGEVKDIAGVSQGYDNFYLRGGQLTNNGASQGSAVRFIDAIDGTSTIAGTGNWGVYDDTVRVRGGATLQKTGANQVSFNSVNVANDGTILVSAGTLLLHGSPAMSGTGVFRVDAGGTLAMGDAADREESVLSNRLELAGGTLTAVARNQLVTGQVTLSNASVLNSTGGSLLVSGTIAGPGSLTFEGAGTTFVSNSNAYTGDTLIDSGAQGPAVVRVTQSNALGTGVIRFNPGGNGTTGRLEIEGNRELPNAIQLSGRNNSSVAIRNITGDNTLSGTITAIAGGGTYTIQSDAGTLRLTGAAVGANGVALRTSAASARTFTLQGAGVGVVSGVIEDGPAATGTVPVAITKAGTGTWTLSADNTYSGPTTVNGGTLIAAGGNALGRGSLAVNNAIARAQAGLAKALSVNALTTTGTGLLDMTDNDLVIKSGTLAAVQAQIASGFNNGDWLGSGINSSAAATDSNSDTALGYADNADLGLTAFSGVTLTGSEILVKYTYYGDADLTGAVDLDDFSLFLTGYPNPTTTPRTWLYGDFDYTGVIDLDDFGLFLCGYQNQGGSLIALSEAVADVSGISSSDRAFMQAAISALPEPASLGVLGSGIFAASARRRSRHPRTAI